jgi:polyisoprenoid-binding protein YceI
MMKVNNVLLAFALCFFLSTSSSLSFAQIEKIDINSNKSSVEFLAIGNPSALKIKGEKAKVQGTVTYADRSLGAKFKVDLNEFVTGIDMRDEHMKEKYLETDKAENRYSTFEIFDVSIPENFWTKNEEFKGEFKGKLKLHNIEKEIVCKISFSPYKKGEDIMTVSKFTLKISDFKIEIPSFVGITMAETVDVEIKLPLTVVEK